MKKTKLFFCISLLLVLITSQRCISLAQNNCARQPEFVNQLQFDLSRSGFSTSDRQKMGIIFAEFKDARNPVEYTNMYQHPSWKKAGFLGTIVFDKEGNVYVAPLPVINSLNNPVSEKNTIFRIDHASGVMEKFADLPVQSNHNPHNPFGIIGMTYDCDLHSLFVSTVEGSDEGSERGKIFSVSIPDKKIKLLLDHTDALGLATFTFAGTKKIFFGSARSSKVFSLHIIDSNAVQQAPQLEIDFSDEGPRGDDKARKIKISNNSVMQIFGVEFEYNLTAPTAKQETIYIFQFNKVSGKWLLSR